MNGLDILKKIRAQKRFEKMPVFVFTNAYLSEFAREASQAGASQVFNKANTTPQQIVEAVNKALSIPAEPAPTINPNTTPPAPSTVTPASVSPATTVVPRSMPAGPPGGVPDFSSAGDAAFQDDLRKSFLEGSAETIATLRRLLQGLAQTSDAAGCAGQLQELYRKVHSITGSAATNLRL